MFKCVVYSKTLYFSLLLLLSCFIHKILHPLLEQFVKLGLTVNF